MSCQIKQVSDPADVVSQQYICEKLMELYGVKCTTDDVLNLDSSTDDKFSRHLIFNLQNAAFKDNIHVGAFCAAQSPCSCQRWISLF